MAKVDFPATVGQPTDGSFQYTANNITYSWNGVFWAANNAAAMSDTYVNITGDVMTGDLELPNLEATNNISALNNTVYSFEHPTDPKLPAIYVNSDQPNDARTAFGVYDSVNSKDLARMNHDGSVHGAGPFRIGGLDLNHEMSEYDEGTWVPQVQAGTSSFGATGFNIVNANFKKAGGVLQCQFQGNFVGVSGDFAVDDRFALGGVPVGGWNSGSIHVALDVDNSCFLRL